MFLDGWSILEVGNIFLLVIGFFFFLFLLHTQNKYIHIKLQITINVQQCSNKNTSEYTWFKYVHGLFLYEGGNRIFLRIIQFVSYSPSLECFPLLLWGRTGSDPHNPTGLYFHDWDIFTYPIKIHTCNLNGICYALIKLISLNKAKFD